MGSYPHSCRYRVHGTLKSPYRRPENLNPFRKTKRGRWRPISTIPPHPTMKHRPNRKPLNRVTGRRHLYRHQIPIHQTFRHPVLPEDPTPARFSPTGSGPQRTAPLTQMPSAAFSIPLSSTSGTAWTITTRITIRVPWGRRPWKRWRAWPGSDRGPFRTERCRNRITPPKSAPLMMQRPRQTAPQHLRNAHPLPAGRRKAPSGPSCTGRTGAPGAWERSRDVADAKRSVRRGLSPLDMTGPTSTPIPVKPAGSVSPPARPAPSTPPWIRPPCCCGRPGSGWRNTGRSMAPAF